MVKSGTEITALVPKIRIGIVIAVLLVLSVRYGLKPSMLVHVPEDKIGTDLNVSPVMEADPGIPQSTVAHVPMARIGTEPSA